YRLFWAKAGLVAGGFAVFGRFPDPVGAGWVQGYLLLLPRGLLQGILGRPACLCRRRASKAIPWRGVLSIDNSEYPPLFLVSRPGFSSHSGPRRLRGDVVSGSRLEPRGFRHRAGHTGARCQRHSSDLLYAGLPLHAPPRWGQAGSAAAEGASEESL